MVPVPSRVRSAPTAPAIIPAYVNMKVLFTLIVASETPSEIPLLAPKVNVAVQSSVPPSITILPGVAEAGFAPRPAEADIEYIPPFIVVVPVYVLVPDMTNVPEFFLIIAVVPANICGTVIVNPLATSIVMVGVPVPEFEIVPPAVQVVAVVKRISTTVVSVAPVTVPP